MYPYRESHAWRYHAPWRRRVSGALPWVFVLGLAAGAMLPGRRWAGWPRHLPVSQNTWREDDGIWRRAGDPAQGHPVDVIRTIDGDTFEARVHLPTGVNLTTRVRLRGIDAPEMRAQCEKEFRMALAASDALQNLLAEGDVTISHIGSDKYPGRVDADVATRRTPDVSGALLAGGFARSYDGGHRSGWCGRR